MAKRFKLRIYRVITATLQSCRSKDPSILPEDPVPSLSPLKSNGQNHVDPSALILNKQTPNDVVNNRTTSPVEFKWQKQDKWHVVAANIYEHPKPRRKICSSSEDDLSFAPPAPPPSAADEKKRRARKKKKKKKMKNNVPSRLRISTSSADSGWFSSEGGGVDERDDEETETLVSSSLSFSTDSSSKRRVSKRGVLRPTAEVEIPARLSVFKKLIPCTVDGKVKESFAIVKRSEDPYEDFKNSMMEMILEKHMFDPKDLEQLLQCFLSLNSRRYHGIIVQAFSEIWEGIFSHPSDSKHNQRRVSRLALSI
ncbi:hypothetical protein DH2020_015855 [Rehmannia glutinosa]|uniref:Transcription repressor n=1 Tax=Rehmannia glutinosa TaxID=99300 RepID=A0ABR0WTU4_REHGL